MKLVKLGLISLLAASALYAGTYNVDKSHSNVGFKVKHMMISNVTGKFNEFKGSFEYDEKTNTLKSLNGVIEVKSVDTANEKRDNHLKESDFFAAEKYPQIAFDLTKVEDDKAYGKLTMRGVTKDVVLDVETAGATIKDPWGNTRTGISLSGTVNRMDYGIKYNSILEAGGVAVGEKVKLIVELEGILKSNTMNPSLFLSHGAPNTILKKVDTKTNLRKLGNSLNKPKYIVMISAHWCTRGLKIINPLANELLYDFMGFELELYNVKFPISSNIEYTNKLLELLQDFHIKIDTNREKFDHGIWTILHMMYEKVDVPIIQLSLPIDYTIEQLIALGEKLQSIRDEALIIGSGSLTHNLNTVSFDALDQPNSNVQHFEDEITKILKDGNYKQILDFSNIEGFNYMHPTHEHFLPIYPVIGSSHDKIAKTVNNEILNKTLSMQGYIFKG